MATSPFHQALVNRLGTIGEMGQVQQLPQAVPGPSVNYGGPGGVVSGGLMPGKGVGRDPISFGKWLQSQGYRVSENPAFGGVEPVHVKNSDHYRGHAYDVNFGPGGTSRQEADAINRILAAARAWGLRYIWQAPGHYNHAHFYW